MYFSGVENSSLSGEARPWQTVSMEEKGTMRATANKVIKKGSSCLVITKFTFSRQMPPGKGYQQHSVVTVLMGRAVQYQGSQREGVYQEASAQGN